MPSNFSYRLPCPWGGRYSNATACNAFSDSRGTTSWPDHRGQGGANDPENIVISCGGCNYNKGTCTLAELGLRHPDERDILLDDWHGLNGRLGSKAL